MPDEIFANPRLATIYDELDSDRGDLDHYVAIVDELAARTILDVGCGTGTFACMLAGKGLEVTGVDPASASLDVARRKQTADQVRWLLGDATTLPPLAVDLATMTGNVAQNLPRRPRLACNASRPPPSAGSIGPSRFRDQESGSAGLGAMEP